MPIEPIEYEMMRTLFDVVAGAALILLGSSVALGVGWLQAHRRARRAERALEAIQRVGALAPSEPRNARVPDARDVSAELDALAIEVERLAEAQRHQTKLLERLTRTTASLTEPRPGKSITPH